MVDEKRVRELLDRPDLAWLIKRVRQRLERGAALVGTVVLRNPTAVQRSAFDRLLGRPASRSTNLVLSLPQLQRKLREAGIADNLEEAVEALTGPVVNFRQARIDTNRRWERLFDGVEQRSADGRVHAWLSDIRTSGLLRRLAKQDIDTARALMEAALRLIERLPANGTPLAEIAASVSGDSHALDPGKPLATLATRAVLSITGVALEGGAEARRDLWAGVGVLCDELSAPVLLLGLRANPDSLAGQALQLHADHGEPYRLTIRQLLRHSPSFDSSVVGPAVYICENPSVVAAAAHRLGVASAPLICIEGQPKTAACMLLDRLRSAGLRLLYHGDFDWPGLRIANHVMERFGALPWRMSPNDYLVAASDGIPLQGDPVLAAWDESLTETMLETGRAVHEEMVLDALLGELRNRP